MFESEETEKGQKSDPRPPSERGEQPGKGELFFLVLCSFYCVAHQDHNLSGLHEVRSHPQIFRAFRIIVLNERSSPDSLAAAGHAWSSALASHIPLLGGGEGTDRWLGRCGRWTQRLQLSTAVLHYGTMRENPKHILLHTVSELLLLGLKTSASVDQKGQPLVGSGVDA